MAPKRNVNKTTTPPSSGGVHIRFSFEHYDHTNKYCLSAATSEQVKVILARLGELNRKTLFDLQRESKVRHFHAVDWEATREPKGFPDAQLAAFEPYQVALLGVNNQRARLYGAYSNGTFYIVWFDLDHHITPSAKRNT